MHTLSLEETYETLFNYIMILLNEKYSFCIIEYKSFRRNLMRNDACIKNDQIVHRDLRFYIN